MPGRAGQLEEILPGNVLHEIAVLKIHRRGDLSRRRVGVARHVGIDDAADHHARLAIGELKLLHQPVIRGDDAAAIDVQVFLHHHGIAGAQAGHLKGDEAAVSVAHGGRRDGEGDAGAQGGAKEQAQLEEGQLEGRFDE